MIKKDKRDKIRLEFIQIDIQRTSKAKRNCDRRDDLGDQSIQIGETRLGNPELLLADPEDRFVVNLKQMGHDNGSTNRILTIKEQSACSKVVCVVRTELYGSTTELAN